MTQNRKLSEAIRSAACGPALAAVLLFSGNINTALAGAAAGGVLLFASSILNSFTLKLLGRPESALCSMVFVSVSATFLLPLLPRENAVLFALVLACAVVYLTYEATGGFERRAEYFGNYPAALAFVSMIVSVWLIRSAIPFGASSAFFAGALSSAALRRVF